MRIGIDAKWYYDGPPSGKVVVRNLVRNLIKINKNNQLYIFLDRKSKDEIFPFSKSNLHLIYIWSGINLISNIFVLKNKAVKLKLDAVLFQNFAAVTNKFNSIAFIHDALYLSYPEFYSKKELFYFYSLKYFARKSKMIITISNSEKERLINHEFSSSDKVKVVYHGVDSVFKPKEKIAQNILNEIQNKYNLPEQFLLYVGRLNIRKNIKNLLLAINQMDNAEIQLFIVGEIDHKMFDIDSFIMDNNLRKRVVFLGFVPNTDLPILYALSTIFCFPSFAEGFGLPIIEAMASGTPVLSSNTTSMPEIAIDAAHLISPENIQEIKEGIDLLLSNNEYANQLSKKGIERSKDFTWIKNAELILKHIEETQNQ